MSTFFIEPGRISVSYTGPVLGPLSLSSLTLAGGSAPGTPLAEISGAYDFNSIVTINQRDQRGYFEVDPLGQTLIAGPNFSDLLGPVPVYLAEVNRGALNSPFYTELEPVAILALQTQYGLNILTQGGETILI